MASIVVKQKNVERLIARCESILSGKMQFQGKEWKLAKYVSALDDQIRELERFPGICQDLLNSFRQRASVLHEVIRTEKQIQAETASHSSLPLRSETASRPSSLPSTPLHSVGGLSSPLCSDTSNALLLRSNSRRDTSNRELLMGKSTDSVSTTRGKSGSTDLSSNIETVLEHHRKVQDEIAEDMVQLARSIRHNSTIAKDIILGDTKILKKTNKKADENISGVEHETERLKEHTRGCAWGIWLMLVIVFAVFVAMVVVIRIVPKPSP